MNDIQKISKRCDPSDLCHHFDIVTMNAVWMCLPTHSYCIEVLSNINKLLKPNGVLIASVTHPCFRAVEFSTYHTNFDPHNYLQNGIEFQVKIHDKAKNIIITDTHWNLTAMSSQLKESGFTLEEMVELPDIQTNDNFVYGSPWLILYARAK